MCPFGFSHVLCIIDIDILHGCIRMRCSLPGRVYNLTHYTDFHPGGVPELMRAAGKDGTQLFDEVPWLNYVDC